MWFVITVHVIISVLLIIVILLQSSKGGGLAASIGGGMNTMMGGAKHAGTFLSRMTTVLAVLFMLSSITIAVLSSDSGSSNKQPKSIIQERAKEHKTSGAVLDNVQKTDANKLNVPTDNKTNENTRKVNDNNSKKEDIKNKNQDKGN